MAGKKRKRKPTNPPRGQRIPGARPPHNTAPSVAGAGHSSENQRNSPPGEQENLTFQTFLPQYTANQHQNDIREQERDVRDRTRLCVEKLALGVGFFGIVGLLVTLCLTREANTLARDAIKQTQDIMQTADRPWVGIVNMGMMEFQVGKKMKIQISLQNSGKTPVLRMRPRIGQTYVTGIPDGPPAIKIDVPYQSEVVVTPNQIANIPIVRETELSTHEFNEVVNGQQVVVVWGTIAYTDQFHIEGETTLCMIYSPIGGNFYGCTHGNNAK